MNMPTSKDERAATLSRLEQIRRVIDEWEKAQDGAPEWSDEELARAEARHQALLDRLYGPRERGLGAAAQEDGSHALLPVGSSGVRLVWVNPTSGGRWKRSEQGTDATGRGGRGDREAPPPVRVAAAGLGGRSRTGKESPAPLVWIERGAEVWIELFQSGNQIFARGPVKGKQLRVGADYPLGATDRDGLQEVIGLDAPTAAAALARLEREPAVVEVDWD